MGDVSLRTDCSSEMNPFSKQQDISRKAETAVHIEIRTLKKREKPDISQFCGISGFLFSTRQSLQKQTQNETTPTPLQLPKIERNLKKTSFFLDKEYSIVL